MKQETRLFGMTYMMAVAASMEQSHAFTARKKVIDPSWKRKKCKSCINLIPCHGVHKQPNNNACEYYSKRKK
jgi:hypothetical protein